MQSLVTTTISDMIATLTLERPERLNALSIPLMETLTAAFQAVEAAPEVKVIVLTGSGPKAFCAGADIDGFYNEAQGTMDEHTFREKLVLLLETLMRSHKPTIARVNGFALGGGFGLAMACDLVVAAEHARFGTPEVNIGLFPMVIMPVLYRSIGRKALMELMLTGDKVSATEAQQLGFVNHVVKATELDTKVAELAGKIASKSGSTLRLGREAFHTMADMPLSDALRYLKQMLSQNLHTPDAREGLQAFLEKRPPIWHT
jgi:enoyl-CoA hydratase/carnithine racemase